MRWIYSQNRDFLLKLHTPTNPEFISLYLFGCFRIFTRSFAYNQHIYFVIKNILAWSLHLNGMCYYICQWFWLKISLKIISTPLKPHLLWLVIRGIILSFSSCDLSIDTACCLICFHIISSEIEISDISLLSMTNLSGLLYCHCPFLHL